MNDRLRKLPGIFLDAIKNAFNDNILHWAAAMAYYAALSSAPLLFVAISVTSFFVDAQWAAARLSSILQNFLPDQSGNQVRQFVDTALSARGQVGLISSVAFLYSGTRVFAALTRALQVVYDVEEEQRFFRELIVQLVMLLTIGVVFLFALASGYFFGLLSEAVAFLPSGEEQAAQRLLAGAFQSLMILLAFFLIYRFIPKRAADWRPALAGAVVATLLFLIVRPIFIFYLDRFGQQDVIYGSLASLVILLLWVWIGAIITLFGGEAAVALQRVPEFWGNLRDHGGEEQSEGGGQSSP